jgi:hypothetical protein
MKVKRKISIGLVFNAGRRKVKRKDFDFKNQKSSLQSSPNKELIQYFKDLASKLGRTPTTKDLKKAKGYNHVIYRNCFGSLTQTAILAGLTPNPRGRNAGSFNAGYYISKQDCLNDLERITTKLGHFPSLDEINKYGKYCADTYRKRLGVIKMMNKHLIID